MYAESPERCARIGPTDPLRRVFYCLRFSAITKIYKASTFYNLLCRAPVTVRNTMTDPTSRDLGRHDAEITSLKDEVKALRSDVAEIKSMLDKTRGGWQALSLAAGIAGAIGAAVMKLVFMGSPTPHP